MVEEKRKRGRPKKIVESVIPRLPDIRESGLGRMTDQSYRRDDLVVQMVMGVINKGGSIKYDFAKDLFNTATELAYDFGWMERPKEKKQVSDRSPLLDPVHGFGAAGVIDPEPVSPLANTPADIFRQIRGES